MRGALPQYSIGFDMEAGALDEAAKMGIIEIPPVGIRATKRMRATPRMERQKEIISYG
jgi:hypothetical protein